MSVAGGWLLLAITIITDYLITSDGSVPRTKQEGAGSLPLIRLANWQRLVTVLGIIHTCIRILYLRFQDAILAILSMGLPITTTLAGEWLISLIFHGNIKCITANGWMIIQLC